MKRKCLWKMDLEWRFPSLGRHPEIRFPFCQCSVIIVFASKKIPKDWIVAMQLIWAPSYWIKGSHLASVGACVHLQWFHDCTFPPSKLGAERELTGDFSSSCSACVHEGASEFCVFVSVLGKAVIQTQCVLLVIIQVGDRHINIKRPGNVLVPLLIFLLFLCLPILFHKVPFTFLKSPKISELQAGNDNKCPSTVFMWCFFNVFLTKLEPKSIFSKLLY